MTAIGARTRDNSSKRHVKRIADRDYKPHEPGAAACRHQGQKESYAEERVDYPKDVIDNLRDSRESSRALHFTLCVNDFVNSLRTKFTGDPIYAPRFARWCFRGSALADFGLNFAFDLTLYRFVLRRPPGFVDRQLIVIHDIANCRFPIADCQLVVMSTG